METGTNFGITADEYVSSINQKFTELNTGMRATMGRKMNDNLIDINVNSNSVSLSVNLKNGRVASVYMNGKGQGNTQSAIEQMYAFVSAARAIDKLLSKKEASNFIFKLISKALKTKEDCTQLKNGIKYTASVKEGSACIFMRK